MEQEFLRSDKLGDAKYNPIEFIGFEKSYYNESLHIDEFNQYLPCTRDLSDTDPLDLLVISSPLTSTTDSLEDFDPDTFEEFTKELMLRESPVPENESLAPNLIPEQSDCNMSFSTSVNNISNTPSELNNDIRMTKVPAKADVDEKAKEIRRLKNNRASKRLRERKKYEEESVLETKKQLLERNGEFKRQTEMLQQEKRTMLWSLKKHIEVILNSSKKEEIRKYLLHFATITDNYSEDNDLKDILGVANKIFKEVIDGHQNPGLIASVINELVKKQQKGVNTR